MKKTATKKTYPFLLVLCGILAWTLASAQDNQPINSIIGDLSFVETFGTTPDARTCDDIRIQTHLSYVEKLLRNADVSCLTPEEVQNRNHLLDLLHEYWQAGIFPRNYDNPDRKPCFIDKDERICAVGYLVEKTAGRDIAVEINTKFKYEHVLDMNDELVDGWIASSGLSKTEFATIQPDYGGWGYYPCNENEVYVCRISNCVEECKCVKTQQAENWIQHGKPCNDGGNGNGHGNGGGNGNNGGGPVLTYSINIHPNPASSMTTISFYLDKAENVSMRIYDINGRLIHTIADDVLSPGMYHIDWDASNINPGLYLLNVSAGSRAKTERITIVK